MELKMEQEKNIKNMEYQNLKGNIYMDLNGMEKDIIFIIILYMNLKMVKNMSQKIIFIVI